jgi:hypothetical protein
MPKFNFTVTVDCDSKEGAERVIGERLGFDEDYGFAYALEFEHESRGRTVCGALNFRAEELAAERDEAKAGRDAIAGAALALLDAFGGDTPDWLREEAAALAAAVELAKAPGAALDTADRATILAALTHYLAEGFGDPDMRPDSIHEIAAGDGVASSLDAAGVKSLISRIAAGAGMPTPGPTILDGAPLPGTLGATLTPEWLDAIDGDLCALPSECKVAQDCAETIAHAAALLGRLNHADWQTRQKIIDTTAEECRIYLHG